MASRELEPTINGVRDGEAEFTATFACNIRKFRGNPFHAETPFGRPQTIEPGDAFARLWDAEDLNRELVAALTIARRHIAPCLCSPASGCSSARDRVVVDAMLAKALGPSARDTSERPAMPRDEVK